MKGIWNISIETFDYYLPYHRIARFPLTKRDDSKLLVYKNKRIEESIFNCLSNFIPANTLLVFNNTQVIQARLLFRKDTGTVIEILCLEPKLPTDYILSFSQRHSCIWLCLVKNAKRLRNDKLLYRLNTDTVLTAQKIEQIPEGYLIQFTWSNQNLTFADILEQCGHLPLPPYLKRAAEEQDKKTYQTIYARIKGSIASPTAGLHFTTNVLDSLMGKNILIEQLTLHIGAGTFQPIKSKMIANHTMHTEYFFIQRQTIENLLKKYEQIFAVGTTSVRTLESLYYIGLILNKKSSTSIEDIHVPQWIPYSVCDAWLSPKQALQNILVHMDKKKVNILRGSTQILIAPGYKFKMVKGIITNFHQPRSTLLLLISAFTNGKWRKIYNFALQNDFRFLSYGDSSLLIP